MKPEWKSKRVPAVAALLLAAASAQRTGSAAADVEEIPANAGKRTRLALTAPAVAALLPSVMTAPAVAALLPSVMTAPAVAALLLAAARVMDAARRAKRRATNFPALLASIPSSSSGWDGIRRSDPRME